MKPLAGRGEDIRFEERVTHLEAGRTICRNFAFPDSSVQDYTERHISPDGPMLKIASGGYRIEPLGKGRMRFALSTCYRIRNRLGWYASLWGAVLLGARCQGAGTRHVACLNGRARLAPQRAGLIVQLTDVASRRRRNIRSHVR